MKGSEVAAGLLLGVPVRLTLCVTEALALSMPEADAVTDCVVLGVAEAHSVEELQPECEGEPVVDKDEVKDRLGVAEAVSYWVVAAGEGLTVTEEQDVGVVEGEDN